MAGELYHPVAFFPTANKFGGQGRAPGAGFCQLGQLWEWEPGSPLITSVPKESLPALAGQPQSYRKLLLQEENETGGIRGIGTLSTY